jgi:hypothetical protein
MSSTQRLIRGRIATIPELFADLANNTGIPLATDEAFVVFSERAALGLAHPAQWNVSASNSNITARLEDAVARLKEMNVWVIDSDFPLNDQELAASKILQQTLVRFGPGATTRDLLSELCDWFPDRVFKALGLQETPRRKAALLATIPYVEALPLSQKQRELWGTGKVNINTLLDRVLHPSLKAAIRAILEARDSRDLVLIADLDAVPAAAITEFIAALDELHRAHGGGGLKIRSARTGLEAFAGVVR